MLKDYMKNNGISVYSLSRKSGVPYSTLNDLVNGKVNIESCKVGLLCALSAALRLSLDDTYSLVRTPDKVYVNAYDITVALNVRNKTYYAVFEYQGEPVELELCKVNDDTSFYIDEIIKWRSEGYIRQRRMDAFR